MSCVQKHSGDGDFVFNFPTLGIDITEYVWQEYKTSHLFHLHKKPDLERERRSGAKKVVELLNILLWALMVVDMAWEPLHPSHMWQYSKS